MLRIALACTLGLLTSGVAATAAVPSTSPTPHEVSLANTRALEFTSAVNGHRYLLKIGLPTLPPPPSGYPVLYVLDSEWYFASALEGVRRMAPNVVVVGVGYPEDTRWTQETLARHAPLNPMFSAMSPRDAAIGLERNYDMSLPGSDAVLEAQTIPGAAYKSTGVGHIDDFLKIIESEVKPTVRRQAKVDPSNQVLFGHSIGGMAVLRALFSEPGAFRTYIAASPAIWWSENAVLAGEAGFGAAVRSGNARPRILITVGDGEETPPQMPPPMAAVQPKVDALFRDQRMIGNACDLVMRLKGLPGQDPYEIADCAVFPNQDHAAVPWPSLGRGIEFAFPRR